MIRNPWVRPRSFFLATLTLAISLLALSSASPAQAAPLYDDESYCVANGGAWATLGILLEFGLDGVAQLVEHFSCTYPEGSTEALAECGLNNEFKVYYPENFAECNPVSSGTGDSSSSETGDMDDSSSSNSKKYSTQNSGSSEEEVSLCLKSVKNGCATFPAGACPGKCTISKSLPVGAANALPSDALATLYVRLIDKDGNPAEGSYRVCFDNPSGQDVVIYQFSGGAWVPVSFSSRANPVCAVASNGGAFYLGN